MNETSHEKQLYVFIDFMSLLPPSPLPPSPFPLLLSSPPHPTSPAHTHHIPHHRKHKINLTGTLRNSNKKLGSHQLKVSTPYSK